MDFIILCNSYPQLIRLIKQEMFLIIPSQVNKIKKLINQLIVEWIFLKLRIIIRQIYIYKLNDQIWLKRIFKILAWIQYNKHNKVLIENPHSKR